MVDRSRAGRLLGLAVLLEVVVGIGGRPFRSTGRYGLAVLLIVAAWSRSAVGCWRPGGRSRRTRSRRRCRNRVANRRGGLGQVPINLAPGDSIAEVGHA